MTEATTRMRVLTVGSKKGGVGKTTVSHNLAAAAGDAGWKVLLVDVDSQSPSLETFQVEPPEGCSLADALHPTRGKTVNPADAVIREVAPNVDLLASWHDDMENVRVALAAAGAGGRNAMRRVLRPLSNDYDLAIIDTPPELGGLQELAVIASHWALAISRAATLDLPAATQFINQVADLREDEVSMAQFLGLAWNFYDADSMETRVQQQELAAAFPDLPVMDTALPPSKRSSSANMTGQPAVLAYRNYPSTQPLRALAAEVLNHLLNGTTPRSASERYGALAGAGEAR